MKFISTKQTNKKGQSYTTRATRAANGYSKQFAGKCPDNFLPLAVHGTFDSLARQRFDFCWITVMHPIDKDYTKRVRILTKNKRKFLDRMPEDQRKITSYKNIIQP